MAQSEVMAKSISIDRLNECLERAECNSSAIDNMVNRIVKTYCKPLDDYMQQIDDILKSGQEVSDEELDDFALNIPSLIYFASEAQEAVGIREDVARAIRVEVFNIARQHAKGTVADKDSVADLTSQHELVATVVYQRAYKKIRSRIDAAYEMLNSIKKVMSRRIASYDITESDRM